MVGSMVTGYTRALSASQAGSAVTVMVAVAVAPCHPSFCVTLVDIDLPTGEAASSCESIMNGAGMVKYSRPPSRPMKAIEPSARCTGVSPSVLTVNVTEYPPAGGCARTMLSFSAEDVMSYPRSAPLATPRKVTLEPSACEATGLGVPSRPISTARPSASKRSSRLDASPKSEVYAFVVLSRAYPARVLVRTVVSIGRQAPFASR